MPGPPFAFGAVLVILALLVAIFIPESPGSRGNNSGNSGVLMSHSPTRRTASSSTELEIFHRESKAHYGVEIMSRREYMFCWAALPVG